MKLIDKAKQANSLRRTGIKVREMPFVMQSRTQTATGIS